METPKINESVEEKHIKPEDLVIGKGYRLITEYDIPYTENERVLTNSEVRFIRKDEPSSVQQDPIFVFEYTNKDPKMVRHEYSTYHTNLEGLKYIKELE